METSGHFLASFDAIISKRGLKEVQNFAVQIVTGARKFEHFTPYLKDLYWLPVAIHLELRDIIMTYKSLNGLNLRNVFKPRSDI